MLNLDSFSEPAFSEPNSYHLDTCDHSEIK